MTPDLSVVIPCYNRAETLPLVLESVARARAGLTVETILVDDGSAVPLADALRGQTWQPDRIIRQENQGLLFARLAGLREASGEYVLFLDSDDLVGPEKFAQQLGAMRATGAMVSYADTATAELRTPYDAITPQPDAPCEETNDSAVFFIRVQPAPHNPIFHTGWLRAVVAQPLFPPDRAFNPVAEIWFYHVTAVVPTTVVKVRGVHTVIGRHAGVRLTNHWERLGVASLGVMEAFDRACPRTPATEPARRLLAAKAFGSWRRLPYDFVPEFDRRLLALWQRNTDGATRDLGGRWFQRVARLLGPERAGRLFRRLSGHTYARARTVNETSVIAQWLAALPTSPIPHGREG